MASYGCMFVSDVFRLLQIKYCLLLQLVIILLHIHKTGINIHISIHALYNNIMVAKIGVAIQYCQLSSRCKVLLLAEVTNAFKKYYNKYSVHVLCR